MDGYTLNELLEINAEHALYRSDGTWYHHLKKFPGVLFDDYGYVVFENEKEYNSSPYLQRKKQLNVPGGISSLPNYQVITERGKLTDIAGILKDKNVNEIENRIITTTLMKRARNTSISNWVKKIHQNKCQICGKTIQLSKNKFYSEGHHIRPLGADHNGPDVIENIICVCPNHHVQLDYGALFIDKNKIKMEKGHEINNEYIEYHNQYIFKNNTRAVEARSK